jgi:hypothetical protein
METNLSYNLSSHALELSEAITIHYNALIFLENQGIPYSKYAGTIHSHFRIDNEGVLPSLYRVSPVNYLEDMLNNKKIKFAKNVIGNILETFLEDKIFKFNLSLNNCKELFFGFKTDCRVRIILKDIDNFDNLEKFKNYRNALEKIYSGKSNFQTDENISVNPFDYDIPIIEEAKL